jgi:hypothetical protein
VRVHREEGVANHLGPEPTAAVAVDGGHVKSVRSYRMRSFEILLAHVQNDRSRGGSRVPAAGRRLARARSDIEHAHHRAERRSGRAAVAR